MTDFSFKIFNATWVVSFIDNFNEEVDKDSFKLGDTNYETNYIRVATKTKDGISLPEATIKLTLLHEMMHAILGSGQYNHCSDDEPLVEWLANCIYSLKEQGKL